MKIMIMSLKLIMIPLDDDVTDNANVRTWQLRVLQIYEQYLIGSIVLLAFRDMFKDSPLA